MKMSVIPSSTASASSNPNANSTSIKSNTKPLNPLAVPYLMTASKQQEQQQPSQQPVVGQVLPMWYYVYQPMPTVPWSYPGATACYNVKKQPFAGNIGTCIPLQVGIEKLKVEEGVEKRVDVSGILRGGEKKVVCRGGRRCVAPPRLRPRRRVHGDSCGERSWVPKDCYLVKKIGGGGKKSPKKISGDNIFASSSLEGKTSLMIRNIPNQFQRHDLLRIVDMHCQEENREAELRSDPIKSAYDFLYLPMDFKTGANLGFAFVNFTNAVGASRFYKSFHKYEWKVLQNRKICEICFAEIQGKVALRDHFKNSSFRCHTNSYLPVVLSPPRDGVICSKPIVVARRANVFNSQGKA